MTTNVDEQLFNTAIRDTVFQARRDGTRWLSTGYDGGLTHANAVYNITVPAGFDETEIAKYCADRREAAGFEECGPTLLTGVDLSHARGARAGPVELYATVGLSNPAALPIESSPAHTGENSGQTTASPDGDMGPASGKADHSGTVNLIAGTTRSLSMDGLANLIAVIAEAKAATLLSETGFPGTTSDAIVAGCDPTGDPAEFTGSMTPVGSAARACTRDAIRASLDARYPDRDFPETVADAEYGVQTTTAAAVFEIENR